MIFSDAWAREDSTSTSDTIDIYLSDAEFYSIDRQRTVQLSFYNRQNYVTGFGTHVLFDTSCFSVKTVKIADLDNPALSRIELNGEILDSAEWTIYRRQGTIKFFKGFIELPNRKQINAQISNKGSMLIYKKGYGIPAEDVISAVSMLMKVAQN